MTLAHVSAKYETWTWAKGIVEDVFSTFDAQSGGGYDHEGPKDSPSK